MKIYDRLSSKAKINLAFASNTFSFLIVCACIFTLGNVLTHKGERQLAQEEFQKCQEDFNTTICI